MIEQPAIELSELQASSAGARMNSPEDLIERARAGDEEAFRQLFLRYGRPVLSFTYTIVGTRDLAEELTQETFLRAFKRLRHMRDKTRFSTWLFGIARNVAREALRARRKESFEQHNGPVIEAIDSNHSPADELLQKELNVAIQVALASLDEDKRTVFILRVFQQQTYEQIATITGFSTAKVKMDLHRARSQVRRRIKPFMEMR